MIWTRSAIIVAIMLGLTVAACGKRGNPVPPSKVESEKSEG